MEILKPSDKLEKQLVDDAKNLIGFSRSFEDDIAYVYFNNSNEDHTISLNIDELYFDILGHRLQENNEGYQITLPAKSSAILIKKT